MLYASQLHIRPVLPRNTSSSWVTLMPLLAQREVAMSYELVPMATALGT